MYVPNHFSEARPEVLQDIIRQYPLGILVTSSQGDLDADHIPFEYEPGPDGAPGMLSAHVARANPVWQRCPTGSSVMVIFRGADAYISPNWYPSKHETHRQVPTWNYQVVHAHGVLTVHDDERFVRRMVALQTRRHEAQESTPWKMGDAPRDYLDAMLKNIVGIEIAVTSLVGKVKASQNKDERDRLGAAEQLATKGATAMADLVRQR